jgi:hypothetical protein
LAIRHCKGPIKASQVAKNTRIKWDMAEDEVYAEGLDGYLRYRDNNRAFGCMYR